MLRSEVKTFFFRWNEVSLSLALSMFQCFHASKGRSGKSVSSVVQGEALFRASVVVFWFHNKFLFNFIAIYHQPFLVLLNLPLGRFSLLMADPCLIMLSRHAATYIGVPCDWQPVTTGFWMAFLGLRQKQIVFTECFIKRASNYSL